MECPYVLQPYRDRTYRATAYSHSKTSKNWDISTEKIDPPHRKIFGSGLGGMRLKFNRTQTLHTSKNFYYLSFMKTEGLTIKNGRLVNNRPNQMTGIQEASMYRQMMKKQYKIDCIADGIERAEMRKGLRLI